MDINHPPGGGGSGTTQPPARGHHLTTRGTPWATPATIHIQEEPPNEGGSFSSRYTSCIPYTCYQGESMADRPLVLVSCQRTEQGTAFFLHTSHARYFALCGTLAFRAFIYFEIVKIILTAFSWLWRLSPLHCPARSENLQPG